jgi:hypothetical protein
MSKLNFKTMELCSNDKIAMALLEEVKAEVDDYFGNTIAMPMISDGYDSKRDLFCEKMVKQCDLAEKKSTNPIILLESAILKAHCYGCWQKPINSRGTHGNAKKYYETALDLAPTNEQKAEIYYRYAIFARTSFMGTKQLALDNFQKAIGLAGENSSLGIECAKELAKTEQKKSGCFIATAVYGSPYASEVIILKEFRDSWLLNYDLGKVFVKFYYWVSPSIANQLVNRSYLKRITKTIIIIPLIKIANFIKRKEE